MTVEEVLLALVGLVAIVLLFLGLVQALEGDPRARLRARRRRLSRRAAGRPAAGPRSPRPAQAARPVPAEPRRAARRVGREAEPAHRVAEAVPAGAPA
ncbi:MAG TPA: hypothetical protein VFT36_10220, partial [Methylomirabilota bacterium]|nr:hypothetical protein [Methylomirabilota bacterium]